MEDSLRQIILIQIEVRHEYMMYGYKERNVFKVNFTFLDLLSEDSKPFHNLHRQITVQINSI